VLELGGVRFTEVSNPTQCPIHDPRRNGVIPPQGNQSESPKTT